MAQRPPPGPHFRCEDNGALTGPTPGADGGFFADLTNEYCDQPVHAVFHLWEVGLPFDVDAGVGTTTTSVLGDLYDQLVTFATAKGVLRSGASDSATRSARVAALSAALQTPDPSARVAAIAHLACSGGLEPFPGAPACPDAGLSPMEDAGREDGGAPKDAGTTARDASVAKDASVSADAGTKNTKPSTQPDSASTGTTPSASGCSMSPGASSEGTWLFGLIALFALLALTRRRGGEPK